MSQKIANVLQLCNTNELSSSRHVAINDNVYFISEQDCLEYGNCNDLDIWCDKMIKKYKPQFFLDIIVRND